ncbi:hypothetical protein D3C81_1226810 [compost metagenome]
MGEAVFASQAEIHRAAATGIRAAVAGQVDVLQVDALVGVEVGVDLVGGNQRGEQGLPAVDQVAGGDFGTADAAVDGRGDLGEAEVEAGVVQLGLGRRDHRTRLGGGAAAGVGQFGGDRVGGTQTLAPGGLVGGARLVGASLRELRFQALDLGLERARVDLEQQVAFLHDGAFAEGHLVDVAGHARTQIDGFRRFQAAGELVPLIDRLLDDLGHADLRRRGRLRGILALAASAEHQRRGQGEGNTQDFGCTLHGKTPPVSGFNGRSLRAVVRMD